MGVLAAYEPMKAQLTTQQPVSQEIEIKEALTTLPGGNPAVELSVNGKVFAVVEITAQTIGPAVKVATKLHVPQTPAKTVDMTKVNTGIHAFPNLINISNIMGNLAKPEPSSKQ